MATDEEILQGLNRGIILQSKVSAKHTGDNIGIQASATEESSMEFSYIVLDGPKSENTSNQSGINTIEGSRERLDELQALIDKPEENRARITEIYNWFTDHVPLIASVITVCDFATTLGLG